MIKFTNIGLILNNIMVIAIYEIIKNTYNFVKERKCSREFTLKCENGCEGVNYPVTITADKESVEKYSKRFLEDFEMRCPKCGAKVKVVLGE